MEAILQNLQKEQKGWDYSNSHLLIEGSCGVGCLYLGNIESAKDLSFLNKNKIKAILDVCGKKLKYDKSLIISLSLEAEDSPTFKIFELFSTCIDFSHEHRLSGRNVLVHCIAGVSRSATIVIAYLMKINQMNLQNAYDFVISRRSCIEPNIGFLKQLNMFEKRLAKKPKETKKKG